MTPQQADAQTLAKALDRGEEREKPEHLSNSAFGGSGHVDESVAVLNGQMIQTAAQRGFLVGVRAGQGQCGGRGWRWWD